ncbi:uncharacterized protein LOC122092899 [Macadamia integrifolia]|uniref:uncharacterized protein LOC122092899 n=1 Tax=Macadamia integrifolia TaxID=60698 RepID=UPI001C52DD76|nr:uncharacterized protein LOC122092899 [Macadamia integrifolia]
MKNGGQEPFNLGSAAEFQAMIDAFLLLPISSTGKKFTWTNNRRRGHVAAVLDRSFCNEKWVDSFRNVRQRVLLSSVSDHALLLVISDIVSKPNNIPFRFHGFWMENENFLPVVDEAWKMQLIGDLIYVLSEKLKRVKGVLKVWAHDSFPNINMELEQATKVSKSIQDSIEESSMSNDIFNKEADAKMTLLIASRRHEALWAEKAELRWVKNGDCNSKLFHLSMKLWRARNQISALKREDGSWLLDQRELLNVASLEATPGREEIKKAVWDMDLDSSPSPDGFSGKFFRKCWEIVETDFGKLLLSSSKLSILVNGGPVGFFPVGKGLRQGDPISPFLFILAEEAFCKGLKLLVRDGKLKSLLGPQGVSIPSHLFFADDIFIFMNASAKYVRNLQDFLEKYQAFSGQNFNLDKSSLFFGKVAPHRKQYISSLLDIKLERLPTKYLGVEIFKGRVKGSHLLPLLDKIKRKLAGWKGMLLSMAGRVELVRSVISSIPVHNFAVYWWPDHSIKLVEWWMRNFIWSGDMEVTKKIVVNWDDVCKPKQEGGLGIRRLRDVNFACLAKLTWQIKHEVSSMSKFFRDRFLKADGSLKSGHISSLICPGIKKVWNFVTLNEQWTVGNGQNIDFWKGRWLDHLSIEEMLLNDGGHSGNLKAKVCDFIHNFRWEFPQVVSNFMKNIKNKAKLIYISGMEDECHWRPSSAGVFSIKSAWEACRRSSPKVSWSSLVWKSSIQQRQAVFGWRLIRNKLALDVNVKRRGWVKLNSDGCSLGNPGKAGGGGILRNEKAEVLYNYREFLQICTNFEAEFQAIIAGFEAANRLGCKVYGLNVTQSRWFVFCRKRKFLGNFGKGGLTAYPTFKGWSGRSRTAFVKQIL